MKKIPGKLWLYSISFLSRAIIFNIALAFSIVALVFVKDGMTIWAIISISLVSTWVLADLFTHLVWSRLSKEQRALYFAIRRHGSKVVEVSKAETERKSGQQDMLEIMRDTDASLEIQMMINGTGTFINVFIGIKWIHFARQFNKNDSTFKYVIVDKDL